MGQSTKSIFGALLIKIPTHEIFLYEIICSKKSHKNSYQTCKVMVTKSLLRFNYKFNCYFKNVLASLHEKVPISYQT